MATLALVLLVLALVAVVAAVVGGLRWDTNRLIALALALYFASILLGGAVLV